MPDERQRIALKREYSAQEFDRIRAGLVPEEMEQKWFIYFEDPWLYLHRSWTGFCIYHVRLELFETRVHVAEVIVNRQPDQYRGTADDGEFLCILLDTLAGRDTRTAMLSHFRDRRTVSISSSGETRLLITYVLTLLLGVGAAFGASWLVGLFWPGGELPVFLAVASWCLWAAWRNAKARDRSLA